MTERHESQENQQRQALSRPGNEGTYRRKLLRTAVWMSAVCTVILVAGLWLSAKANTVKSELEMATRLVSQIKGEIASTNTEAATKTLGRLRQHTSAARDAAGDPIWTLVSAVPVVGTNFTAVTELARSADDVTNLALSPLITVVDSVSWDNLVPKEGGADLRPIKEASPSIVAAAHAVRVSAERLRSIDSTALLPQVAVPLKAAREELDGVTSTLADAADASKLAPTMLGAENARKYLLIVQNNAEARATGGIPGALAVLTLDKGKLTLDSQSTAGDVGVMTPVLPVDEEQKQIYSARLGKFMQDVNLTPHFPTTASLAKNMWERRNGQRIDGVVSVDPVVLGYILDATGPVELKIMGSMAAVASGLPATLNSGNVVQTLLSDVYAKIPEPHLQDEYFAVVAQEVFGALVSGTGDAEGIVNGIIRGASEGRVLIWSGSADEQSVIARHPVSGSISGSSISPAQFGLYFNDGTGAKMDYYVKRTVQLIEECPRGEYGQVRVRVTSTNTAPQDAATSLPAYVTGDGAFGVPAGTVQTNVVAYGPVQSNVESAMADGKKISFASQLHSGRPVGTVTVVLPPGKSSTIEFLFDKIVQHTEPQLSVTPTVQPLKEVLVGTSPKTCVSSPKP